MEDSFEQTSQICLVIQYFKLILETNVCTMNKWECTDLSLQSPK